jgi:hypothetical protein
MNSDLPRYGPAAARRSFSSRRWNRGRLALCCQQHRALDCAHHCIAEVAVHRDKNSRMFYAANVQMNQIKTYEMNQTK